MTKEGTGGGFATNRAFLFDNRYWEELNSMEKTRDRVACTTVDIPNKNEVSKLKNCGPTVCLSYMIYEKSFNSEQYTVKSLIGD